MLCTPKKQVSSISSSVQLKVCQLLTSVFPGEQQNEKFFFIHILSICIKCSQSPGGFLPHVFPLKSISLFVAHVVVTVKVNGCERQGLEGETVFFICEKKSRQVVRHLNPFSSLKCLLQKRKWNFCCQGYILKIFPLVALEDQALWIICRVVL